MRKIFKIVVNRNDESGMSAISLVQFPAVEHNFLKFDKNSKKKYKFNQEKHIISGIVALADVPIYRYSPEMGEYWVVFDKETIRTMVEKYAELGLFNSVNLGHDENRQVKDCFLIESYIIDKERGICPKEFEDAPDGSWIASFKVEDENLWEQIKNGTEFNGFSLEGMFELEEYMNFSSDVNILKQINQEIMKLSKIALRNLILRFEDVNTDKGIITVDGDIAIDAAVFVGENPAEDGEYALEDGRILVIADGKIAEIKEAPVEEPVKEEPVVIEGEDDPTIVAPAEEPVMERPEEKIAKLLVRIGELEKENEDLRAKLAEKDAEVEKKDEELKMSVEKYMKEHKITPKNEKKNVFKSYLK